ISSSPESSLYKIFTNSSSVWIFSNEVLKLEHGERNGLRATRFLSWDSETSHVDLEKELQALTSQAPEGEEANGSERLIQYATENLVTEVLIHPQVNTLLQCVRNLLSSFTRHRHLIHAGYTFAGNGSWILQDGTFSLADFIDAFVEPEVQRVLKAYENCITVDVHCSPEGDWATERIAKEPFARSCKVRVNPDDRLTAGGTPIGNFINYINPFLRPASLEQLLEPSDVVGNIRFSHPTLYVFPGGQGDAALFGINGFNMLVDGGFARKACFWDFARHLDRLDAVLMTRLNNGNVNGMSAVLRRKKQTHVYPQIGHFFCNLQERRHATSPDGDKDRDALLVNLLEEGQEIVLNLRQLQLRPHPCYRDGNHVEPVNLYHKVGHGKLDMYIISPAKDSRDIKEFLSKWNANDPKLFGGRKEGASLKDFHFPLQNLVSICALLVWQPANPNDTITRILFPGSTPQHKIFEGLDKLKHLEFLKYPVCTARSISPSASTVGITSRASSKMRSAPAVIDKLLPGEGVKTTKPSEINKQVAKTATIPVAGSLPDVKQTKPATTTAPTSAPVPPSSKAPSQTKQKVDKLTSKTEPPKMKTETNKSLDSEKISAKPEKATKTSVSETPKPKVESKGRTEPRTSITKSKSDTKTPRSTERKSQKPPTEKKSESAKSSPTTPKKSVEAKMNGTASKAETAKLTRTSSRTRPSPTTTPAKSTKEANNRKVVESKYQHVSRVSSTTRASTTRATRKEHQETATIPKSERKPISRRPKPASPGKASAAGKSPSSPAKSSSAKSTPTPSVKSDKDGVIRKVKGEADKITTDSSAVSTPSTVEPETAALKVKPSELEAPEVAVLSEPKREKEEEIHEKESEDEIAKPKEMPEKAGAEPDNVVVEEEQIIEEKATIQEQPKGETSPQEVNEIEKSTSVETEIEQVGGDEVETEDKESEAIGEEILQEKDTIQEKEDIEATEEEKTEDMEEEGEDDVEEPEEQQIEIKQSLADELELDIMKGGKPEDEEEEEDEEDEYLIIEKEEVEQYMEDSLQEQESVESHMPEESDKKIVGPEEDEEEEEEEGELQKHLRDEVESEKEKKQEADEDFVKVNGFLEDSKDTIDKDDVEHDREDKSSPLKEEKVSDHEKQDEKMMEKEKEEHEEHEPEKLKSIPVPRKNEQEDTLPVSKEMTAETKEQIEEEVQEIITSAKEIVKTKRESETKLEELGEGSFIGQKDVAEEEKKDTEEADEVKEASSISPEEKLDISSEKNREITDDTRDTDQKLEEEEGTGMKAADQKYPAEESQPDERFSTTVESAATTAPTLPEDERIPLDEIKEIVEEKYVKEETKEEKPIVAASATQPRLDQPTTLPQVVVAAGTAIFDPTAPHAIVHLQRDIVKTPDEVADLPVHEEVDPGTYESEEFSRDFKSKDDSSKKQQSQQEVEDVRGPSPDIDMKADLHLKYDIPPEKQVELNVDEGGVQLPCITKEETKETIETEPEKKTEKLEDVADKVDIKDVDKTEKLETKEMDEVKESQPLKDAHEIPQTEEKLTVKEPEEPITTELPTDEAKKTEIAQEDKETEVEAAAQLKDVSTIDTEKITSDIKEDICEKETPKVLDDKLEELHLEKQKTAQDTEKEVADEICDKKLEDDKPVKPDEVDEDLLEKQGGSKELHKSEKHMPENGKDLTSIDSLETNITEIKAMPEIAQVEQLKVDKESDIKQITEQFIEIESLVDEPDMSTDDNQDFKPSITEVPEDIIEDKVEKEEKTDHEKPIPEVSDKEKTDQEPVVEISETEKFELEVMKLEKEGKEQINFEKSDEKPTSSSKEMDKSDMEYSEKLPIDDKNLAAEMESPEVKVEEKLESQKSEQQVEDKAETHKTESHLPQYEDEKLEKEEKESEKMDKEKTTEVETKDETIDLKDDSNIQPVTEKLGIEKPESFVHDKEDKSSTLEEDAKPTISDKKGEIEEITKESIEMPVLKESITSEEEKDIDEKDKINEKLPLTLNDLDQTKVDKENRIDDIGTNLPSAEVPKETETLEIEEKLEETPSPGALSMTYLEIIDKLQKDSQKEDDKNVDLMAEQVASSSKEHIEKGDLKQYTTIEKTSTSEEPKEAAQITEVSSTAVKETKKDEEVHDIEKVEEYEIIDSAKLQDSKDSPEKSTHAEVIKTEEKENIEQTIELSVEKSVEKDFTETVLVSDDSKIEETKKSLVENETGFHAELKLSDERDDSFGDESLSPGEAYVDSGLEEEPVKLEAPEVPEYVTVTPDSAPGSPKIQRDQTTTQKSHEKIDKQGISEKDLHLDTDEKKEKVLEDESVISEKLSVTSKEESLESDKISKHDISPPSTDEKKITDEVDVPVADTCLPSKEAGDIPSSEPIEKIEPSSSTVSGKELGEASFLDDLASAKDDILTAPQKDKDGTKYKVEIKTVEEISGYGSSEKDSIGSSEEVKRDIEDVTVEEEKIHSKLSEDKAQNLIEKEESKVDDSITKKDILIEEKPIDKAVEEKEEEKSTTKIHESLDKKSTISGDKVTTELHDENLEKKVPFLEDKPVLEFSDESSDKKIEETTETTDIESLEAKITPGEEKITTEVHDESLDKKIKETTEIESLEAKITPDAKITPEAKITPGEEKITTEVHDESLDKKIKETTEIESLEAKITPGEEKTTTEVHDESLDKKIKETTETTEIESLETKITPEAKITPDEEKITTEVYDESLDKKIKETTETTEIESLEAKITPGEEKITTEVHEESLDKKIKETTETTEIESLETKITSETKITPDKKIKETTETTEIESLEAKITPVQEKLTTEVHDESLDKKIKETTETTEIESSETKITPGEEKTTSEVHDESLDKIKETTETTEIESLEAKITPGEKKTTEVHDESLDKKMKETTETTEIESLEAKITPGEEKTITEVHDGSLDKKIKETTETTEIESLEDKITPEKSPIDEKLTSELKTEESESKILASDKTLTEFHDKEKKEILTDDKTFMEIRGGVHLLRETHITTTEENVPSDSEDMFVSKSTVIKTESIIDTKNADQKPTTSFDATILKTEISKDIIQKSVDDKKDSPETTAVTTTKETTVVTDVTKTTTATSSDSSCISTTTISEITSAKVIAEKESSAILSSTIATVSSVEKEKDSSGSVHRMMVTASSEDGGTETELCPSPTPISHEEELPGTSSGTVPSSMPTSTIETKEEKQKSTKECIIKEDISKTIISSELGATNGDIHLDYEEDIDEGGESGSDGEFGTSKEISRKTTKTTTTVTRRVLEMDGDELEPDDKGNYEEVTTQEIDEDNIESTAAEDGSDSSRISKTTTSFTTVTKPDDNGVRSLSTDSSDKTGDAESEIASKTTTTTVTISKTVTGEESGERLNRVARMMTIPKTGSADSSKPAVLSKESSPSKSISKSVMSEDPVKEESTSSKVTCDSSTTGSKDLKTEIVDGKTSSKNEAELRTATPGSDAMSDRELEIGCGTSTPHSDISSGQVSRAATNVWAPTNVVTSQLAHSPPSNFDFEMGDRNTSEFEIKHSTSTSGKHKEETSTQSQFTSSMTSSFYGSLPPDPLQELLQEQKDKDLHKSSTFTSETTDKYDSSITSKDSAMTSSFYGSLGKKDTHHPDPIGAERYTGHIQEDEPLDFERAMYEHRAARGKDLTPSSSSHQYESSVHTSKYEHFYTPGVNGQKQKDEHSYEDYGNGNVAAGKQFEDLMNQNREIRGEKVNGKGAVYSDPIDSGFHSDTFSKGGTSEIQGKEHDPMFHHQFVAPTTSASSFPDVPQGFVQAPMGKPDDNKKDPIADWGKPLGLPAPAPPPTNNSDEVLPQNTNKSTPKKEKKVMQMKKTMMMNENNKAASGKEGKSKRPESPIKQPSSERKGKSLGSPIYIDLTYVPHHGNSYYTTLEFFKKVRARYYVFSGTEPSREVYNALLDAKQTWEDKELEVTIIPTYDTDTLGYWVAENEDTLAKYKIDLSPSASRCTINLQDHETSCSAYRLEF
ncbi:hypothetical protein L9F63_010266, partial [Diploptera punctata]